MVQDWTPGGAARLGGREYRVEGPGPDAHPPKGESRGHIVVDPRNGYRYLWRAYRGLAIQDGHELVRDRRKERQAALKAKKAGKGRQAPLGKVKAPATRQAALGQPVTPKPAEPVAKAGLWGRLTARFRKPVKAPS